MFRGLFLSTLVLACSGAIAQPKANNKEFSWGVGIAAIAQDQGYIDIGNETILVPVLAIQYGNFSLLGPRANYKIIDTDNYEISLTGHLRLDGYEADDADFYAGMEDRDMSFDMGVSAELDTDFGEFGLELIHDLTSTHEGYEVSVSFGTPIRFEKGTVKPYISASYESEDLVDYYYGVSATEARINRPLYQGDGSVSYEIGVSSDWFFGKHHMLKADVSYTSYASEIKDSPLIDKSGYAQIILGYVYVF
ncbi:MULTISPECIES: MipA/OmpV family protein [Pseudoalteromonas]|uniref:Structural protein MipA n=1 Tax=Pseudoalteromonas amylolytica TaxID=1859457 RepID=A0A1S1MNM4_9GAMM|nr:MULTISPECIES: MipA/OmpV family protein [Pseudoalteromonas]OHU85032.1 hypothetical protein BFC16_20320 [Pseudoalteromonas sp. JW3]OHU90016.1 hypothetical protein BET10_14655 [Pseudoalteromonas amylolytica]